MLSLCFVSDDDLLFGDKSFNEIQMAEMVGYHGMDAGFKTHTALGFHAVDALLSVFQPVV